MQEKLPSAVAPLHDCMFLIELEPLLNFLKKKNVQTFVQSIQNVNVPTGIENIHIPRIGLELACNGGSCGGISLKRD